MFELYLWQYLFKFSLKNQILILKVYQLLIYFKKYIFLSGKIKFLISEISDTEKSTINYYIK